MALTINDRDRAEEVVQEAFARAFRRWRTVSRMERPVGWVYVVALNAERSRWRRADQVVDDLGVVDVGADPSGQVVTTIVTRGDRQVSPRRPWQ